jgi:L-alanine-DL-glutamate epimerase-like enolase superfamily enzyme
LRIRELACYSVEIPPKDGTYTMSQGRVLKSFPSTVVKVTADDGTVGYGEACTLGGNYLDGFPASARETVRELAEWVLDCDALEADVLVDGMDSRILGHLPGKAAIDHAMWDLRGKLLGQPVARLLGGVKQRSFGAFEAISLDTPAAMAEELRRMADVGFRRWQLKLGTDPDEDAARVHSTVQAMPADSTFVTSDANRGWTVAQTLRFLGGVEGIDTYLEQPCRTVAELARIRPHSALPMLIDESVTGVSDLVDALALGCADAINLKPVRVGGLTKAARIRDLAQSVGVMILVDEPQGADLATAGMSQLAATINPSQFLGISYFMGEDRFSYQRRGRDVTGPSLEDGVVTWNEAPGLGVEVDEETLGPPVFKVSR